MTLSGGAADSFRGPSTAARMSDRIGQRVRAAAGRPVGVLLAPVLLRQAARVRARTPVLPEAAGDRSGRVGGVSGAAVHLLVVGESTAAGVGVAEQRDGLAHQLAVELAHRRARPVAWQLHARTGATASAAAREFVPAATGRHDLVVVALGVNDALRLRGRRYWRQRVIRLLDDLQPLLAPQGQVLLAGVPALGAFPALPQPLRAILGWHAGALDGELRRLAASRPTVRHAPMPPLSPEMFAADGFHPNAQAYARWVRHLADHAEQPRPFGEVTPDSGPAGPLPATYRD